MWKCIGVCWWLKLQEHWKKGNTVVHAHLCASMAHATCEGIGVSWWLKLLEQWKRGDTVVHAHLCASIANALVIMAQQWRHVVQQRKCHGVAWGIINWWWYPSHLQNILPHTKHKKIRQVGGKAAHKDPVGGTSINRNQHRHCPLLSREWFEEKWEKKCIEFYALQLGTWNQT